MKKCFCVLVVAALLSLSNIVCWATSIQNGSFETFAPGKNPVANADVDGFEGWTRWGFENNEASSIAVHSGSLAFKGWYNGGIYQDFSEPVTPGSRYKVSCYMLTPSNDQLSGSFYGIVKLEWLDASDQLLTYQTKESERFDSSAAPDTWKLVSVEGEAPAEAVKGRIVLEFRGEGTGSGVILWDDADVQEIKPE